MKFLIVISIGMFIFFSLPSMVSNYTGDECLPEEEMEKLKEKILETKFDERNVLEKNTKFLPGFLGFFGQNALHINNEMKTVMYFFCFTKNYIESQENCSKFSEIGCYSDYTQKCKDQAYITIRENLAEAVCPDSFVTNLGLGNRVGYFRKPDQDVVYLEGIAPLLIYVALIITFTYMIYYLFNKIAEYDNAVLTPKDFTVKVSGLPTKGTITTEQGKMLRMLLTKNIESYG